MRWRGRGSLNEQVLELCREASIRFPVFSWMTRWRGRGSLNEQVLELSPEAFYSHPSLFMDPDEMEWEGESQ
jgi:hypothetical protein